MKRRLILRSFSVTLLILCATAWTQSYFWQEAIVRTSSRTTSVALVRGHIYFSDYLSSDPPPRPEWTTGIRPINEFARLMEDKRFAPSPLYAGFRWQNRATPTSLFLITVPLWFLTALFAITLCGVWRKTRLIHHLHAFPAQTATPKSLDHP